MIQTPGRLLLALLVTFGVQHLVSAQGLRVDEASVGFRAATPRGPLVLHGAVEGVDAWLPCDVVLTNTSSRTYTGTFQLVEGRLPVRAPILYTQRVTLGPGARQRLAFPVLYDATLNYALRFVDDEAGRVELLRDGARATLSRPLERPPAEAFVLVARKVGDDKQGLSHLQPRPPRDGIFERPREWSLAQIDPGLLPERGILYHRVDALVLDDVSLDRLTPAQQSAILEFVARGGLLWVSLLTQRPGVQSTLLQAALPGQLLEPRELKEVRALEAFTGDPCRLLHSKTFMTFRAAPDAVRWNVADPVLLHRRHERGWIVLAGFRFAEQLLPDPQGFLRDLLDLRERTAIELPGGYDRRLRNALRESLRVTTKKAVPPLRAVVMLIGAYLLCAVALPYLLMRRSGRLEWAWLAVAGMSLGGTGAVFMLGEAYEQPTRAVRVGFVTGGGDAGPHLRTSYWAVFSKDGGPLPLTLAQAAATPFPFGEGSVQAPTGGALGWADGRRVTLQTHPQDTSLLVTSEPCSLAGGLRFSLTPDGRSKLENRGQGRLLGAWAFDAKEQPLDLELPPLLSLDEERRRIFESPLQSAQRFAAQIAQQRGRPVLLYAYEGERALEEASEVALDLGLLDVDGWPGAEQLVISSLPRESTAQGAAPGVRLYTFTGHVPEGMVVEELLVDWAWRRRGWGRSRDYGGSIRDWHSGRWVRLANREGDQRSRTGAPTQSARGVARPLWLTPVGLVRGQIQVDANSDHEPQVRLRLRRKTP